MFDFYNMFYTLKYLSLANIQEATKWGVLTPEQFKTITGQDYAS